MGMSAVPKNRCASAANGGELGGGGSVCAQNQAVGDIDASVQSSEWYLEGIVAAKRWRGKKLCFANVLLLDESSMPSNVLNDISYVEAGPSYINKVLPFVSDGKNYSSGVPPIRSKIMANKVVELILQKELIENGQECMPSKADLRLGNHVVFRCSACFDLSDSPNQPHQGEPKRIGIVLGCAVKGRFQSLGWPPRTSINLGSKKDLPQPDENAPLCVRWVLQQCTARRCPFRHYIIQDKDEGMQEKLLAHRANSHDREAMWAAKLAAPLSVIGAIPLVQSAVLQPHAARAGVFVNFLLSTFGKDVLSSGSGVVDVAGGSGDVAHYLWVRNGVPTTTVDPVPRRNTSKRRKKEMQRMGRAPSAYIAEYFNTNFNPSLLESASAFVGMHPDEATEDIVDAALKFNKPFAVIPCCVFSELKPGRKLHGNIDVSRTDQFCLYLAQKDARIKAKYLPFEGRNIVVYLK